MKSIDRSDIGGADGVCVAVGGGPSASGSGFAQVFVVRTSDGWFFCAAAGPGEYAAAEDMKRLGQMILGPYYGVYAESKIEPGAGMEEPARVAGAHILEAVSPGSKLTWLPSLDVEGVLDVSRRARKIVAKELAQSSRTVALTDATTCIRLWVDLGKTDRLNAATDQKLSAMLAGCVRRMSDADMRSFLRLASDSTTWKSFVWAEAECRQTGKEWTVAVNDEGKVIGAAFVKDPVTN